MGTGQLIPARVLAGQLLPRCTELEELSLGSPADHDTPDVAPATGSASAALRCLLRFSFQLSFHSSMLVVL